MGGTLLTGVTPEKLIDTHWRIPDFPLDRKLLVLLTARDFRDSHT